MRYACAGLDRTAAAPHQGRAALDLSSIVEHPQCDLERASHRRLPGPLLEQRHEFGVDLRLDRPRLGPDHDPDFRGPERHGLVNGDLMRQGQKMVEPLLPFVGGNCRLAQPTPIRSGQSQSPSTAATSLLFLRN